MKKTWNDLPNQVLLKIFRSLNMNDRKNVSLTCKKSSRMLNFPPLWSSVICLFHSEKFYDPYDVYRSAVKLKKCLPLVMHCSAWIQELTIVFYKGPNEDEETLEIIKIFVKSLADSTNVIQLRKFSLAINYYFSYEDGMQQLISPLRRFLHQQNMLISFSAAWDMHTSFCSVIISAVTSLSARTLKGLEIRHYDPRRFQGLYSVPLNTLHQLQYLTLPSELLDKYAMRALANNCQFLTLLTMSITNVDLQKNTLVAEDTWTEVSEKLPQLRVAVQIGISAAESKYLNIILSPTIPLIGVRALCYPLNPGTIFHLYKFRKQIRSLELLSDDNKYLNIDLINACPHLTMLKVMSKLSTDTVDILTSLNIKNFRDLKRVALLLEFDELLQHRELEIKDIYRHRWSSSRYFLEIVSSRNEDTYKSLRSEDFCRKLFPAI